MLYSQQLDISKESHSQLSTRSNEKSDKPQYGKHSSHSLLGVPCETLTGITSYLDPPSLFSLSRVNAALYHHVGDDNTWRTAFTSRYLGIGPESELHSSSNSILLRPSEKTWRNEFISRFKLERKWENSPNSSISHVPVPSAISHIHLMSCQVVLSSCLKYGIVARSLPLNGKVYSGYLSAAANGIGIGGIGNPNMEFSPNASTCVVTSRGGSASIFWGFSDGTVALLLSDKVMDPKRITAAIRRCSVQEEHQGSVSDSAWDSNALRVVSGGSDGQVKLWNTVPLECVWTSERQLQGLVTDPCAKVAIAMKQPRESIAASFLSGKITLWTGFQTEYVRDITAAVKEIPIPCPAQEFKQMDNFTVLHPVTSLHIDVGNEVTALLIAYKEHPYFYRITVDIDGAINTATFGDPSFGSISSLSPFFALEPELGSFVIAGDCLGYVSIYDWRSTHTPQKPVLKFEADEDGAAVTAIAWNSMTLITGSSRGSIHVWDGLTYFHLRSFASHPGRRHRVHLHDHGVNDQAIKQIIIDASQEMFVACAGDRVQAWRAGPLPPISPGKHQVRSMSGRVARKNRSGYAKYLEQLEMKENIKESRRMVEQENESYKRAFSREKEHRFQLEKLGLTETEAVEYAMMLSLEEGPGRAAPNEPGTTESTTEDVLEAVFEMDESSRVGPSELTDISYHCPLISRSTSVASTSTASDFTLGSDVGSPTYDTVCVPVTEPQATSITSSFGKANVETRFPSITDCSPKPVKNKITSPNAGSTTTTLDAAHVPSGSSWKLEKSWSSVAGTSTQGLSATSGRCKAKKFQPVGVGSAKHASSNFQAGDDADVDEDLRYALELSLAEAESRGEA